MAKAKPRKGGSGKNKKSGKHRGAPKAKAKKTSAPKTSGGPKGSAATVVATGIGGARPQPMEVDPGYYILKQYFNSVEYEVGRVLVDANNKEHWFLYNLTQPSGSYNGYTYPDAVQSAYHSQNVSTRFVYQSGTPPTIAQICQAVGSISTYKICTQSTGSCP